VWGYLAAYPIASASAAAFYAVLLALAVPAVREWLLPRPDGRHHLAGFDTFRGVAAAMVATIHCLYFTWPVFSETQYSAPFGAPFSGRPKPCQGSRCSVGS
jgi:hypothetical protein